MGETFELEPDKKPPPEVCAACSRVMGPGDVICIACGFDRRLGEARTTSKGVATREDVRAEMTPTERVIHSATEVASEAAKEIAAAAERVEQRGGKEGLAGIGAALLGEAGNVMEREMRAGEAGEMGVEGGEEEAAAGEKPLCGAGFPGVKTLCLAGGIVGLGAAAVSAGGMPSWASLWLILGRGALTVYEVALHTGTGVVALFLAGLVLKRRVGALDIAGGRMLLAASVFYLLSSLPLPALGIFGYLVMQLAGAGAYWLVVRGLFRATARETNVIAGCHAGLYVVTLMGTMLAVSVNTATAMQGKPLPQ